MLKHVKRQIAQVLAVVVLLVSIPLNSITAEAASSSLPDEIAALGLEVGKDLIDTSVSAGDVIANRDDVNGWEQDKNAWSYGKPGTSASKWGWSRGKEGSSVSASVVSDNTIRMDSISADNVILLPTLPSSNYKFEATFTVVEGSTLKGSFGLITNFAPKYEDISGGTLFVAYAAGKTGPASGSKKVYSWNRGTNGEKDKVGRTTPDGYTAPAGGSELTLTVYVYEGVNYYYINGNYAGSAESIFTTEGESLCGFYQYSDETMPVEITNISVKELIKAGEDVPTEMQKPGLKVYGSLIDTSVSAGDVIANRDDVNGWEQDKNAWSYGKPGTSASKWGWSRGKEGSSVSASVVSDNTIRMDSISADNVILLPTLPSSNYKFEATFTVVEGSTLKGSFGLITNFAPKYEDISGGTLFVAYAAGKTGPASGSKKVYSWNRGTNGEKDKVGRTTPDGYTAPAGGSELTLTVYVYEGVNYYYINGNYAGSAESIFTTEGESLCGFYQYSDETMPVEITNISVRELRMTEKDPSDTDDDTPSEEPPVQDPPTPEGPVFEEEDSLIIGEVLYETDFEDATVGTLPEGWQKGYKANGADFGYVEEGASMVGEVVKLEGYGKVVNFASTKADAYITTPSTGTLDYIFEANVVVNFGSDADSGQFGLANNFNAGVNSATGCMYTSIYNSASGTSATYRYRNKGTKGNWDISHSVNQGDIVKLKIISYKGNNYIYYNGELCAIAPHRTVQNAATSDNPGFFTWNGNIYITDVKITEIYTDNVEFGIDGASLSITEEEKIGIDVGLSFDKTQYIYSLYFDGNYTHNDADDMKFGVVMAMGDSQVPQEIEVGTEGITNTLLTTYTQDDSEIAFIYSISDIVEENYDKFYTVRPYVIIEDTYFYGEAKAYSAAELANGIYAFSDDDALKEKLTTVFANSDIFVGKDAKTLTFTLFSDFHYIEGMYPSSIADLKSILKRADDSNSAFIMSAGDFCNDAKGSPELFNAYHNYITEEGEILPAYNIYGNHELEKGKTLQNTMEVVTKTLTNDTDVKWGTVDGSYDYNIAYYYFESNGFRIVCIDTQYSYNPGLGVWEHNRANTYEAPSGNTYTNSLGPTQLAWLKEVLTDAASEDIPCIVVGHDGFSGLGFATTSSDAETVREIFKEVNDLNPGTVLMCINGHLHTNNQGYNEGVFYMDTNTTRNGVFSGAHEADHYLPEHTFMREWYDDNGELIKITEESLNTLSASEESWFYADPLSAVITINEYGVVTIDGTQSKWAYDIVPFAASEETGKVPRISSGTYFTCELLGHDMVYKSDETHHWTECSNALCNEATQPVAHTYDQKVISEEYKASDASCEAKATYYYSCVCGAKGTKTFEAGELAEHSYGEWSVTKEATATETGLKEHQCSACGDIDTEEIPVISEEPGTEEPPSTPGSEETPSTPGTDETPGTSGSEETPSTPGTEETPSTPGSEETPSTPGTDESPGTSGSEETPSTPGTEETPGTSGSEELPSTPETDETPGTSGGEETPSTPGSEETPSTPGTDESPGTSGSEETPSTPGTEETPGTSGSEETPSTPGTEETPGTSEGEDTPDAADDEDDSDTPESEEAPVVDANAPETGDNFKLVLWVAIIIACGVVLSVTAVYYSRKEKK